MAATFSYAQAAKGLSSAPASSATASKPSSGSVTPAKDQQPSTAPSAAVMSWADDAEANDNRSEQTQSSREPRTQQPIAAPGTAAVPQVPATSIVSSPDLGASSASTVTKDDDVSSIPNTSSDSTWENKSQASTSVEKSESSERSSEKGKGKNIDRSPAKPLQDAPIPVVNIWKQRAEEAKARVTPKATTIRPASAISNGVLNGAPQGPTSAAKQSKGSSAVDGSESRNKAPVNESKINGREEEKSNPPPRDAKPEVESDKVRKSTKNRPLEKDVKSVPTALPLPPDRDQEAWPTPETAVDEDRKKAYGKSEKSEKDRKESSTAKPSGKKEWVNMAITPTVIFNTPLPNSASSRRGGRGAGRGGAQGGGRSSGFSTTGPEKDGSTPATLPNGDQPKRGRADGSAREASPKGKRTVSTGSIPSKDKPTGFNGDKSSRVAAPDTEVPSRRASIMTEPVANSQAVGQSNTFPRGYPSSRSGKGRRGEFSGQDRRKDGDSTSPTKENGTFNDRRTSTATQTEGLEESERRTSNIADGQPPYQSKRGSNDRQYGTFSGRDRGRGGGRGRGNYQNGHQFANGHAQSLKSSSTFPGPLSPTTFNPDQNAFFPQASNRYRNGPRSQSVTNESMYRGPGQYGGPQVPPIHTYMGSMYDYPLVQPMSAVPFGSFGMDHLTLFSMVTTQLEYYFSLENLCKDIYLRKQMDSQGFVFLSVIAEFNRIKQLTSDIELIKLVCFQSRTIEHCVGSDGKDRLRRREGWEQWVLPVSERNSSAQHDGPDELHNPPIPHPHGFDQNGLPRYPEVPAGSPTGPAPFSEGAYPPVNGYHPGAYQHSGIPSNENVTNGTINEGVNGAAIPNGHPIDNSTKAVSGEPDSFSDEQVESLTVIVRKQDQSQMPTLPPSATRTFSNGSIDSRSEVPGETERVASGQANVKVNGSGPSLGVENEIRDQPRRARSPFAPASSTNPVRLYWVKDKDAPVDIVPSDSTHESYTHLRAKALQQRQNAALGSCPYDLDVLYQFWSHFLIRNFNSRMYDEFRHLAFEDATSNLSDVGLTNLIKFYGESLLSSQNLIRERVARDYVDLVRSENEHRRPAFTQLRSAFRNGALDHRNRRIIGDLLDSELKSSLT